MEKLSTCEICGNKFLTVKNSQGRPRKYCSDECRRLGKPRTCSECGKMYRGEGKKYCSRECTAAAKHAKGKPRSCRACGKSFIPVRGAVSVYCSEACKPKQPEACAHCGGPMPPFPGGHRPMVYCGTVCKHASLRDRAREKSKTRKCQKRDALAIGLRMWRHGECTDAIAKACGWCAGSVSGRLLESKAYKRITMSRKSTSKWYENESNRNARSKSFRLESHFRDHAQKEFASVFDDVRVEVVIPGTRRKIDVLVCDGLFRYGVELKNGNRTARLDQTLGQAIVKCHALGGLSPVCVVPDDVKCDKVFLKGCASVGVIAGTLSECLTQMRVRCCK